MGIKSTTTLTRKECIEKIKEETIEYLQNRAKENITLNEMSNEELENLLEHLREENGYIFDNYTIKDF